MKELLLVEDYCALIAFIKKIKWQVTDEKLVVCSKKTKNNANFSRTLFHSLSLSLSHTDTH